MRILMSKWCRAIGCVLAVALLAGGCAASRDSGGDSPNTGNLDEAVVAYRKAVQAEPDNLTFKLAARTRDDRCVADASLNAPRSGRSETSSKPR